KDTVKALARLNYVAFMGLLVLVVVAVRRFRWRGWTPLLLIAVVSTPILYQATSSFGESLAAAAVPAAAVAARWRRPLAPALATVLIGATSISAIRNLLQYPRAPRRWAPGLAVTASVAGFSAVLASWYAPFGWETYGSRLMMPLLPAAVVAAVYCAEPSLLNG